VVKLGNVGGHTLHYGPSARAFANLWILIVRSREEGANIPRKLSTGSLIKHVLPHPRRLAMSVDSNVMWTWRRIKHLIHHLCAWQYFGCLHLHRCFNCNYLLYIIFLYYLYKQTLLWGWLHRSIEGRIASKLSKHAPPGTHSEG
jgi:hypothetical protein